LRERAGAARRLMPRSASAAEVRREDAVGAAPGDKRRVVAAHPRPTVPRACPRTGEGIAAG